MFKIMILLLSILSVYTPLQAQVDEEYIRNNYTKIEKYIPMRDGVRLFTAIYTPKQTSIAYPIMLTRTPYGIAPYGEDNYRTSLGPSKHFVEEGYIFVYQDIRGKRMSEGDFVAVRPFIPNKSSNQIDESSDTYDTIEWLLKNIPNNNGRVGTWGISAPGFYTTHTIIESHPALKASSPQAPVTDWFLGDDRHHNGAFMLQATFSFLSSYGAARPELTAQGTPGFSDYGTPDGYQWYLKLGPISNINKNYLHYKNKLWNAMIEHSTYDAWWQARTPLPHLKNVTVPTMVVGGFFDAQDLYGPLKTYEVIERYNPQIPNILVMGPWWHGGWSRGDGDRYQDIHFGSKTSLHYRKNIELPFFNFYLKDKGKITLPEASIFVSGSNEWHHFNQWPPQNIQKQNIYLHPKGKVSFNPPETIDSFAQYTSDPEKPVPHTPKIVIRRDDRYVIQDQRFASTRPDVLVFESEILKTDITMTGHLWANIFASTTGTDADYIVKLIDVYPDTAQYLGDNPQNVKMGGFQFMVRGEVMRAKFRNSFENPEPMVPDKITEIKFDMQDVAHTFKAGHKIMVQIQSSWFPMVDINPQKYVDIYHAVEADFQKARHKIYFSKDYPSHLKVDVLNK